MKIQEIDDEEMKELLKTSEAVPEHDARGKEWIGICRSDGNLYQMYIDTDGKIWRDALRE